jgi:hypothetical protein
MAAQGGAPAPPQSGQCNLDNAVINLTALRDHEKKELTDIISSVRNSNIIYTSIFVNNIT